MAAPCASVLLLLFACSGGTRQTQEQIITTPATDPYAVDETRCDKAGKNVVEADLNGDLQPDSWRLGENADDGAGGVAVRPTCEMTDLDYDGTPDFAVAYDNDGNRLWEKFDLNADDKFDRLHRFDADGSYEVVRDVDFDGTFDKSDR